VQPDKGRSPEAFALLVLGDAVDDPTGVYEVWWLANAWYPDWPLSERLRAAEQAVAKLVCDGLVTLGRGDYQDAADHPIPLAETADVLRDWATWAIPQGPDVYMFATDEGVAAVMSGQAALSEGAPEPGNRA
jgi:hypothetical protein